MWESGGRAGGFEQQQGGRGEGGPRRKSSGSSSSRRWNPPPPQPCSSAWRGRRESVRRMKSPGPCSFCCKGGREGPEFVAARGRERCLCSSSSAWPHTPRPAQCGWGLNPHPLRMRRERKVGEVASCLTCLQPKVGCRGRTPKHRRKKPSGEGNVWGSPVKSEEKLCVPSNQSPPPRSHSTHRHMHPQPHRSAQGLSRPLWPQSCSKWSVGRRRNPAEEEEKPGFSDSCQVLPFQRS